MKTLDQKWRKRFQNFGGSYDEDHLVSGWSAEGLRNRVDLLKKIISETEGLEGGKILDIGCGPGTYVRILGENAPLVVGFDFSIPSLRKALSKDVHKLGHYVGGDAYKLPFFDNSFDVIVSIGTLQTMETPEMVLAEIQRVLRGKGILILEFLNGYEGTNILKTLIWKLRGQSPRVKSYSPFEVEALLVKLGIVPFIRKGIFLPPRQFPRLRVLWELPILGQLAKKCSLLTAHAFFVLGEKSLPVEK